MRRVHQKHDTTSIKCSFNGCNYSSNSNSRLNEHLRWHNPDPNLRRPFLCFFLGCEYRAGSRANLKRHYEALHNPNRVKKFPGPLCATSFYAENGLDFHVRGAQLKEKGYKCDECSFATVTSSQLRRHRQRTHDAGFATSEFSFKLCGYRAFSKRGLACHRGKSHRSEEQKLKCLDDCVSKAVDSRREPVLPKYSNPFEIPVVILKKIQIRVV